MFCGNCGSQLNSDAAFCPNCGAKVVQDNLASQTQNEAAVAGTSEEEPISNNPNKSLLWGLVWTVGVFIVYCQISSKYEFKVDEFRTYFIQGIAELLNFWGLIVLMGSMQKNYKYRVIGIIAFIIGIILAAIYAIAFVVDLWHLIFD